MPRAYSSPTDCPRSFSVQTQEYLQRSARIAGTSVLTGRILLLGSRATESIVAFMCRDSWWTAKSTCSGFDQRVVASRMRAVCTRGLVRSQYIREVSQT